jgi:phage repressor protein C with HTH and peptisase S24 domain
MSTVDIYVEALKRLCEAEGGAEKVAAVANVSAANLKQILAGTLLPSGNPRGVGPSLRKSLSDAYPEWLHPVNGVPRPKRIESNVADAPALAPSRLVPVVGHVKGGIDGYLEEMQYPVGHGEGFVEYWTKDDGAYALRVKGDSMHPRYRASEFVIITPSIEPQPGRDVLVKMKDGRKLLKQLNWIRGDEIQLLSINDGYGPTTLSLDEIESIQRVAGGVPPDAFLEARPQH